jgi:hypothetical protein
MTVAKGVIFLNEFYSIIFKVSLAKGTNNCTNLNYIWLLMRTAVEFEVDKIQIRRDSSLVIDWINGKKYSKHEFSINSGKKIGVKRNFYYILFIYIYIEHNDKVNVLSKKPFSLNIRYYRPEEKAEGAYI